jgi:Protein of unknown function (DUF4199)
MEKKPLSHIIKGLIIVAAIISFNLSIEKSGLPFKGLVAYLPSLLLIAGVAVSCIVFGKQKKTTQFAELFAHGFKTASVIICLMAVYTYVSVKFISAPLDAATIENAKKELIEKGNIMPLEAEQKVKEALNNRWVFLVAQSIFASLVGGAVGAGLGALISSKRTQ